MANRRPRNIRSVLLNVEKLTGDGEQLTASTISPTLNPVPKINELIAKSLIQQHLNRTMVLILTSLFSVLQWTAFAMVATFPFFVINSVIMMLKRLLFIQISPIQIGKKID